MAEPTLLGQLLAASAQLGEERAAAQAAQEQDGPPGRSQVAEAAAEVAEEKPKAAEDGALRRLRAEHERLKVDMAVLCRCLQKRGLLSDVDWHRERFEEEKRRTGWSPGGESLQTALAPQPAASRTTAAAGHTFASFLHCASQSLRTSLDAVQEERLFVVGGEAYAYDDGEAHHKSSESFIAQAGAWQPLPAMGWARAGHAGAALGGCLFVCGGDTEAVRASVMRYNPQDEKKKRWRFVRSMDSPRQYAAAAALGQRLYVCGGSDGTRALDSVERFQPGRGQDEKGEWEELPPMAARRDAPAAVAFQGHFFVCGGWDGRSPAAHSSAEMFSPLTAAWQGLPSMMRGRYAHAAAVLRGRVYAAGGEGTLYGRPMASVELYDPAAGAWSSSAELPRPRALHVAAVLAGRLYVCGGRSGPAAPGTHEPGLSSAERFDPETGTWEAAPPMSQARLCFCAAVLPAGPFVVQ